MTEVNFILKPISEKPSRKYRKGSKYDPIIDSFLRSGEDLVRVDIDNVDKYFLNNYLKKRIELRHYSESIDVSIVNNELYIETLEQYKKVKNDLKLVLMEEIKINEGLAKEFVGIVSTSGNVITSSGDVKTEK